MKLLYEDENKVLHECEGERIIPYDRDTYIVWTRCLQDVPADKSFKSEEEPTCGQCILAKDVGF